MKLVYPPKPVEDLYLSGFTLTETHRDGLVYANSLGSGWNTVETVALPGLGIIARLGIDINTADWVAGDRLGWRVDISSSAFGTCTLAMQWWHYGELPLLLTWDYYPRLPFLTTSTLIFKLFRDTGLGWYGYNIYCLLQDYS